MAGFVWGDQPSSGFASQGYGSSQPQNAGTFNNNQYQNPQMGMFNPNSQMDQYNASFQPSQSMWQGAAPGHHGQDYSYNPMTGQGGWENTAGGLQIGGSNPYGAGAVSWTDPKTGLKAINPDALMGAFGMSSSGGEGYNPYQMTAWQGNQISAPDAYGGGNWDVANNVVNVHDVIESYRPTMEAEIGAGFANAGNRLGQSGMSMSSSYAKDLGEVEALARAQMNQRGLEYQYNAGQFDAENQMQAMMGENAEKFGGWQTQGGWDMGAQMANQGNAFNQWAMENQFGFQDNQSQNQWNQQQQMQQQQMLASLLGGLL